MNPRETRRNLSAQVLGSTAAKKRAILQALDLLDALQDAGFQARQAILWELLGNPRNARDLLRVILTWPGRCHVTRQAMTDDPRGILEPLADCWLDEGHEGNCRPLQFAVSPALLRQVLLALHDPPEARNR